MEKQKRETFKDVAIEGKSYRIGKFSPLLGGYMLYKLLTGFVGPILPMINLPASVKGFILPSGAGNVKLSKEDFIELERDCLSVVTVPQDIRGTIVYMPVIRDDGTWNVPNLEEDMKGVMLLIGQVIGFNMQGFFSEAALKDAAQKAGLTMQDAPT
jgi:hypothetical protein